jgi:hypothetical protein
MRPQKITFGEMREMGVLGIFVHSRPNRLGMATYTH